jgi:hypothetical protein
MAQHTYLARDYYTKCDTAVGWRVRNEKKAKQEEETQQRWLNDITLLI